MMMNLTICLISTWTFPLFLELMRKFNMFLFNLFLFSLFLFSLSLRFQPPRRNMFPIRTDGRMSTAIAQSLARNKIWKQSKSDVFCCIQNLPEDKVVVVQTVPGGHHSLA